LSAHLDTQPSQATELLKGVVRHRTASLSDSFAMYADQRQKTKTGLMVAPDSLSCCASLI
jgi:hypothetical protein